MSETKQELRSDLERVRREVLLKADLHDISRLAKCVESLSSTVEAILNRLEKVEKAIAPD